MKPFNLFMSVLFFASSVSGYALNPDKLLGTYKGTTPSDKPLYVENGKKPCSVTISINGLRRKPNYFTVHFTHPNLTEPMQFAILLDEFSSAPYDGEAGAYEFKFGLLTDLYTRLLFLAVDETDGISSFQYRETPAFGAAVQMICTDMTLVQE